MDIILLRTLLRPPMAVTLMVMAEEYKRVPQHLLGSLMGSDKLLQNEFESIQMEQLRGILKHQEEMISLVTMT